MSKFKSRPLSTVSPGLQPRSWVSTIGIACKCSPRRPLLFPTGLQPRSWVSARHRVIADSHWPITAHFAGDHRAETNPGAGGRAPRINKAFIQLYICWPGLLHRCGRAGVCAAPGPRRIPQIVPKRENAIANRPEPSVAAAQPGLVSCQDGPYLASSPRQTISIWIA